MIAIFDEDGGGDVDFQEFVSGLSAFSSKGNKEEKLKFAFKVYDIDRDGYISNGELFIVLKMMVGSNLKDQQLQQIVDKTIMEADLDHDGKISFAEFQKMVENTDVSMSMTLGKDDLNTDDTGGSLLTELQINSRLSQRQLFDTRKRGIRWRRMMEEGIFVQHGGTSRACNVSMNHLPTYESGCLLCFNCTPFAFSHA